VQVERVSPIPKSQNQRAISEINTAVHDALRELDPNNVWQFYQLVEAQWQSPVAPQAPCTNKTGFFPACNVANATMETFQQKNSCMSCHLNLAVAPTSPPVKSDLTFELGLAWSPSILPSSRITRVDLNAVPNNALAKSAASKGKSK
jgi:hypothetical protein